MFLWSYQIALMCSFPRKNKMLCDNPKYTGVDVHLFVIAADKSMEYGFDGVFVGNAANMGFVRHYCEVFKAEHIAMLHPYQIAIYEKKEALPIHFLKKCIVELPFFHNARHWMVLFSTYLLSLR